MFPTQESDLFDLIVSIRAGNRHSEAMLKKRIYPAMKVMISRRLQKEAVTPETQFIFEKLVDGIRSGVLGTVHRLVLAVLSSCEDGCAIQLNEPSDNQPTPA